MFRLPNDMRILRSPNAAVMVINFTRDVKHSFITETHLTEVATVFIYTTENVNSKDALPWKIIFL
jgi:hypothetical protein